jgi:predicted metal-dependent hydrolase
MSRKKILLPHRPENLHIIVREIKFDYKSVLNHLNYWYNNNPVISHFYNALQATFPEGEKMFIQAAIDGSEELQRNRRMDTQLKKDMKKFIRQEANHSQYHRLWTKALLAKGYTKLNLYDEQLKKMRIWFRKFLPASLRLAITAAAEHFTASLAFLFSYIEPLAIPLSALPFRRLLLYHAMEELEHKSVCFDLYQKVSGNYIGRLFGFLFVCFDLTINVYLRVRYLLKRDGIWDRDHKKELHKFLIGKKGLIKGLLTTLLRFIRFNFHPWKTDERKLINHKFSKHLKELEIKPLILERG